MTREAEYVKRGADETSAAHRSSFQRKLESSQLILAHFVKN